MSMKSVAKMKVDPYGFERVVAEWLVALDFGFYLVAISIAFDTSGLS